MLNFVALAVLAAAVNGPLNVEGSASPITLDVGNASLPVILGRNGTIAIIFAPLMAVLYGWLLFRTTRGFEISFLDIIALALLIAMWLRPRKGESRFNWPASLAPLLVYFGYCALSVLFSDPKLFGMFELFKVAQ